MGFRLVFNIGRGMVGQRGCQSATPFLTSPMQDESGPPMPPPTGAPWGIFPQAQPAGPTEVDLKTLRQGDRLVVGTKNTRYEFEWHNDGQAHLTTDRTDRPWGLVTVAGCVFRVSGVLAPGVVFCGGKLEFVSTNGQVRHRTTPVSSVSVVRPAPGTKSPNQIQLDAAL